ncbi:hypothetical protein Avbf_16555 [Armadillidium vulgare]|nr:hypothetical protein Avbf_16555 [Armadillidium vulgare]
MATWSSLVSEVRSRKQNNSQNIKLEIQKRRNDKSFYSKNFKPLVHLLIYCTEIRSFQNTSSACVFKKFVEKYQEEHSVQKLSMEYIKTCSGQAKGFTYRQTKSKTGKSGIEKRKDMCNRTLMCSIFEMWFSSDTFLYMFIDDLLYWESVQHPIFESN